MKHLRYKDMLMVDLEEGKELTYVLMLVLSNENVGCLGRWKAANRSWKTQKPFVYAAICVKAHKIRLPSLQLVLVVEKPLKPQVFLLVRAR